jgi:hypothetical protein
MYKRAEYQIIKNRLEESRKFIQVVMGARQIGKSTVVKQVLKDLDLPYLGAPDKPCGVGRADANPKLLLNDT